MRRALITSLALVGAAAGHAAPALDLATLKAGDRAHRFEASAIYLDAADRPLGARFVHRPTGFQLDLLQIESVPQAFTWVKTFATSDQGEPHTQEHLLLLRGIRGRTLATKQSMSLVTDSAYTETWRTSYFFNTAAGLDTFFDLYAEQQRAMLHPDYSDDEIRLEVRNFGVTKAADGTLALEEKGTVYNEMVASMANGAWQAWRAQSHAVYGTQHALGYNQGGEPAGIRTMTPEDIRRFHAATHHLANMGAVAAFPRAAALDGLLARFDRVLMKDAPKGPKAHPRPADSLDKLPPPAGDPEGALRVYEYPHVNAQQPSPVAVVWPATRKLDAGEQLLAELFFANLAGDASTNLYGLFIDSRSRKLDTGASSVGATVEEWGGHPIAIEFSDVRPAAMTDDGLRAIRSVVEGEIARIAAFSDGSAELKAFNERISSRVAERERQAVKFLGTPPGFGARNGSSAWANLLLQLEHSPGTRKSLVLKPEFAKLRALLDSNRNVWREALVRWNITGVVPYVIGARPSAALIAREQAERTARLAEETEQLKRKYATADTQQALARHAADADASLARIDRATKVPPTPFVKTPPMTLDDGLQFESVRLAGGVPLVASRFDSMTGALTGLALRLDGVPREELRYLALLPELLTRVGVIDNGLPVLYEQMSERLRREILALTAGFSTNTRTGRAELVLRGSGVGLDESRRALDWMARVLYAPDWRSENLPRIRDVVDQQLAALRSTVQSAEENWVNDPANAWRLQRNPAWLATASFLTRTHNALRLRWQLLDPAPGDGEALAGLLTRLAETGRTLDRPRLKALLAAGKAPGWDTLSSTQRALAGEALRDLDLSLVEMPDTSLGADFADLTLTLRDDLALPATEALARLDSLRRRLLKAGGARMFLATSQEMRSALAPQIESFAGRLDTTAFTPAPPNTQALIGARLRQRGADAAALHVGLHAPNKQGGVILTSVPSVHYADAADKDKLLDFLATRLYGGGGSHGVFSKTVGAGLAYSNGLRGSISSGRVGYYAERTPELPQTVRFVVGVIKDGQPDPALGEYVMAQAFGESRASQTYEARSEGIAADLADGQPPELVRRFRSSILALRRDPRLVDKLYERKDRVHARLLPGYAAKGLDTANGSLFVIGPDKQLDAWEQYLQGVEGPGTRLQRLYGRDFWMP
jgi:Zn-dependent M16 (insulinase) family peptidase